MKDGMHPGVSDADYHRDRGALSSTGARLLLPPSCPAKFREWCDNPPIPKPQFDIGHVVHQLVLGKGTEVVEIDAPDYRGKDAKTARDKAHADGKAPVLPHELDACRQMADAVLAHPTAGPLLTDKHGASEVTFYATDPATGVRLRARADRITFDEHGRMVVVDLKTSVTAEPNQFARKAADLRYHFQGAFYLNTIRLCKAAADPVFVLVAVEKEPPYLVSVVEFDPIAMLEGERLVRLAVDVYHDCASNNAWPGYDTGIHTISLPPWMIRQADRAMADNLIEELKGIA
jgi:RecB family exonuclease